MMTEFRIDHLPNGFTRIFHRRSGLASLWHADGTYRSGDLRQVPRKVLDETFGPDRNQPHPFARV